MSPQHSQNETEKRFEHSPMLLNLSNSLHLPLDPPPGDSSHVLNPENPALAAPAVSHPVPSPITDGGTILSNSNMDLVDGSSPATAPIGDASGDTFVSIRAACKPPRIDSSSDVVMDTAGVKYALSSPEKRPAHVPASEANVCVRSGNAAAAANGAHVGVQPDYGLDPCSGARDLVEPPVTCDVVRGDAPAISPADSSFEGSLTDIGLEIPPLPRRLHNSESTAQPSSRDPAIVTGACLANAAKDLVATEDAHTKIQESCYVQKANPGHPVKVYAEWVKTFYPLERCPVPTQLPESSAERRNFKDRLTKSENPAIADIHAFYPWVGIYQERRRLSPLFWKMALQMIVSPRLDTTALNAITNEFLRDELKVEAVISSYFKSLKTSAQRRALECFKNMTPRDAAKTLIIRHGGTLVGLQLKPYSTEYLTIEEAEAARPIIERQLRDIGDDAALECEVILADWSNWWEDAESNIRDGIPVEVDSKLAADLDRALNAYIISIYCARVNVQADMHFESIRITPHMTVHREATKRQYPSLEYAPMWKEYFGNGDSIFMPEPAKHPKVFEALSDFYVDFSDYDIEQWPELAEHSGKRYMPVPVMVDWIPFMITTNFHWAPGEAKEVYNRMWAPGADIPQCFIMKMHENEFMVNSGKCGGEFFIHGLMAPSRTDAPITTYHNTGGDHIVFTAFEHIRHCTNCYKTNHSRRVCPQTCRVEGRQTKDCPESHVPPQRDQEQADPNYLKEEHHIAEPHSDAVGSESSSREMTWTKDPRTTPNGRTEASQKQKNKKAHQPSKQTHKKKSLTEESSSSWDSESSYSPSSSSLNTTMHPPGSLGPSKKTSRPLKKASRPLKKASRPLKKASRPLKKASRPLKRTMKSPCLPIRCSPLPNNSSSNKPSPPLTAPEWTCHKCMLPKSTKMNPPSRASLNGRTTSPTKTSPLKLTCKLTRKLTCKLTRKLTRKLTLKSTS